MKKKSMEVEVPKDFVGEITLSNSKATSPKVELLTQEFTNAELNVLKDKLNEVIKSLK